MKLRYQLENEKCGVIVYESDPEFRTLFTRSQVKYSVRVPLPHMLFVVKYTKTGDKFVYPGYFGIGLQVFCGNKPLGSLDEELFCFPTDTNATVCTNHTFDNSLFDSPEELAKFVVSLWYGATHNGIPDYKTLEAVLNAPWVPHRFGMNKVKTLRFVLLKLGLKMENEKFIPRE